MHSPPGSCLSGQIPNNCYIWRTIILKKNLLLALLFLGISLCFSKETLADGTLTVGGTTVNWRTTTGGSGNGSMDWVWSTAAVDHSFQLWFWYRINGETAETVLGIPTSESFVGNTATLNFVNVDGKDFDVTVTLTLTDILGNQSQFQTDIEITNNGVASRTFNVYNYLDLDKGGTISNEMASLAGNTITITETVSTEVCMFSAIGALAAESNNWPLLRDDLNDAAVTTFSNLGFPFGPADWTGGWQWVLPIASGSSATASSSMAGVGPAIVVVPPHTDLPLLPSSDFCANAVKLCCLGVRGSTSGATFDNAGFCGTANTAPGVWYTFKLKTSK